MSARFFIESEKIAQAFDEFAKQLKVMLKLGVDTVNIHSECMMFR